MRIAAITALGVVTGFGPGAEPFWQALLDGRSAFGPIAGFCGERILARQAVEAPALPSDPLGESTERADLLLLAAASEVLAGVPRVLLSGPRTGVALGTTMGGNRRFCEWLDGSSPDPRGSELAAPARLLARRIGAEGPVLTLSSACASGTSAVGTAARLVTTGAADRVLAGGVDALSEFVVSGFDALRALSRSAVRPFDARRDGLGLGEGAAVLLVEELGAARARGARPLAVVRGYGSAADAFHMTRPSPSGAGLVRALQAALAEAGCAPGEVGFVSAHGTGTVLNDAMEAEAFRRVFGARGVPVNSVKGAIGHTLGAAGALEAALTALVLSRGVAPPTPGLLELDPALPIDAIASVPRALPGLSLAVSTSSAFAGSNAALVLGTA